eukprot:COSAG02_NODE_5597_length_4199_cov_11.472778_2_plen_216_part_00
MPGCSCSYCAISLIRYVFARDEDLPAGEVVTADMQLGDVLILGNLVPHCKPICSPMILLPHNYHSDFSCGVCPPTVEGTTENLSQDVRWSLDLRWQDPSMPCGFEWEEGPTGTVIGNQCVRMQSSSELNASISPRPVVLYTQLEQYPLKQIGHFVLSNGLLWIIVAGGPERSIDWEAFAPGCTRSDEEKLAAVLGSPAGLQTIEGPWMTRWETAA